MSRLGKKPISVPSGVEIAVSGRNITISKGDKRLDYELRPEVTVNWEKDDKTLSVTIDEADMNNRQTRAYWGLTRALLQNMVVGVTEGYSRSLEVVGVGYSAVVAGQTLDLKVGFANVIKVPIPQGLDVTVDRQFVHVKGADKQKVGQFAAEVRSKRKPEPYNGKGIKYTDEVVRRKQGKAFGA